MLGIGLVVLVILGVGLTILAMTAAGVTFLSRFVARMAADKMAERPAAEGQAHETFMIEEWRHNGGASNPVVITVNQEASQRAPAGVGRRA